MRGGVVVGGLLLVAAAVFCALVLGPAADQWGVWFGLGVATGVGGAVVGIGVTS